MTRLSKIFVISLWTLLFSLSSGRFNLYFKPSLKARFCICLQSIVLRCILMLIIVYLLTSQLVALFVRMLSFSTTSLSSSSSSLTDSAEEVWTVVNIWNTTLRVLTSVKYLTTSSWARIILNTTVSQENTEKTNELLFWRQRPVMWGNKFFIITIFVEPQHSSSGWSIFVEWNNDKEVWEHETVLYWICNLQSLENI